MSSYETPAYCFVRDFQGGGLSDMKEGGLGYMGYPSMYHPYDPSFAAAAAAAYPGFNG